MVAAWAARTGAGFIGRGGSAFPGFLAERIDPRIVQDLANGLKPVVLIVGTNGKTTTTRFAAQVIERASGDAPLTNSSGANLRQGIASTLLAERSRRREPQSAVFEVDELALEAVAASVPVSVLTALNLFRDQLDRFGEVDTVVERWRGVIRTLPPAAVLVYCADDPRLRQLADEATVRTISFGLEAPIELRSASVRAPRSADPVACPICGRPYEFAWRSIGHLGDFRCPARHVARRSPDVTIAIDSEDDLDAVCVRVTTGGRAYTIRTHVPGLSGAYNVAAAVATAMAAGLPAERAALALERIEGAFGRLEEIQLDGRRVVLALAKNAASLSESLTIAGRLEPDAVLLAVSDAAADGRDASWIWDASLGPIAFVPLLGLAGSRASDLAIRVKYEDAPNRLATRVAFQDERVGPVLKALVARVPRNATVVVLASYTALLEARRWLERRGVVGAAPR
jgi:lipid II isoglutaminyl synthase (glutamine-hydrolysing)